MATSTSAAAAAAAALPLPLFPKPHPRSSSITRLTPPFSSLSRRTITPCVYRRRASTAGADEDDESRRNRRRRRRWLEDTSPPSEMGIVEEILDGILIFKIFRFYGWWLVPILISMLLATGPKAFLLALAVMTGLSVLTLAFTKLWGSVDSPKRKFRAKKKKTRGRTRNNIDIEEEEEEEGSRMIYRSWVSNDDGTSNKGDKNFSDYKGWDELDGASVFNEKTKRRSPRVGRSRREEKFMRREGGGEMPLLLRLLIAVFPFLGSWTKML